MKLTKALQSRGAITKKRKAVSNILIDRQMKQGEQCNIALDSDELFQNDIVSMDCTILEQVKSKLDFQRSCKKRANSLACSKFVTQVLCPVINPPCPRTFVTISFPL